MRLCVVSSPSCAHPVTNEPSTLHRCSGAQFCFLVLFVRHSLLIRTGSQLVIECSRLGRCSARDTRVSLFHATASPPTNWSYRIASSRQLLRVRSRCCRGKVSSTNGPASKQKSITTCLCSHTLLLEFVESLLTSVKGSTAVVITAYACFQHSSFFFGNRFRGTLKRFARPDPRGDIIGQ